jgi:hypothetical protein
MSCRRLGWDDVSLQVESLASCVIHVRVRRCRVRMAEYALAAGYRVEIRSLSTHRIWASWDKSATPRQRVDLLRRLSRNLERTDIWALCGPSLPSSDQTADRKRNRSACCFESALRVFHAAHRTGNRLDDPTKEGIPKLRESNLILDAAGIWPEAERIRVVDRVAVAVPVQIEPTRDPNRVLLRELPRWRI